MSDAVGEVVENSVLDGAIHPSDRVHVTRDFSRAFVKASSVFAHDERITGEGGYEMENNHEIQENRVKDKTIEI